MLLPPLNMVLFAEALSEATTQGICEKTTLLENLWDFSSKNIVQFFHSKSVVNSILFVGKTWNFTRRDCIKDLLVSSSQIHKSMSRYHNKDIKILVALLPTLINSEVIEAAARNCCLKRFLPKISKNLPENTLLESRFWKIILKEKTETLAQLVFRGLC